MESRGSASSGWTEIKKRGAEREKKKKRENPWVELELASASVASLMLLSRSLSAREWRACVEISAESGVTRFSALTRPCPSCSALLCHFSASLGNHILILCCRGCRTGIDFHFLPMLCPFFAANRFVTKNRIGPVLAPDDGFIKQGESESNFSNDLTRLLASSNGCCVTV